MSKHIDQVSIDLKFELLQTLPQKPRGKGKMVLLMRNLGAASGVDQGLGGDCGFEAALAGVAHTTCP
jgi:hypothetical protein